VKRARCGQLLSLSAPFVYPWGAISEILEFDTHALRLSVGRQVSSFPNEDRLDETDSVRYAGRVSGHNSCLRERSLLDSGDCDKEPKQMTSFDERLTKAIERGQRRSNERERTAREQELTEEEFRNLHSRMRLQLSEHIEACISQLANHFPGFQYETIFGEKGWGAACKRDDIGAKRASFFSRLEMTVRPYSPLHVVELTAKGTIRNKEVFSRTHYELINKADTDTFRNLIDVWVLEYAELFAAT
jgi:hypothetical protein